MSKSRSSGHFEKRALDRLRPGVTARAAAIFISIFISIFSFVAPAARASVEERASAFVLCKNQKNVRTIRVIAEGATGPCKTMYTKKGYDKIVSDNRSIASCKSVLNGIRTNLEAANWNCRTVQSAQIILSDEAIR